ncbi:MAG: efflux RND transporter periplasmic adaptor subunit [Candidatus Binataceae bacterium]
MKTDTRVATGLSIYPRTPRLRAYAIAHIGVAIMIAFAIAAASPRADAAGGAAAANPAAGIDTPKLAPIQLTGEQRRLIGVTFATVKEEALTAHITTTGTVAPDERLEGYVQTRFSGWIRRVYADYTYQYVRKDQPLFTIYSPALAAAENDYLIAQHANLNLTTSEVEGVAAGAASLAADALERLRLSGVSPGEIARLKRDRTARETVTIYSPMSGYVLDRAALPNMYVDPATRLYTIADLSHVWVYAAVFQDQIGEIKTGDPVTVTVDAYPGKHFAGHVDFIWNAIDPATRTARVRCDFANRAALLKVGMFVSITLKPDLGQGLVIPDSGVLRTGTHDVVFVDRGGGYLTPTEVELGVHAGHEFVIRKGLRAGERIVSSANFLIDSESQLQAALGTFVPPPPGASAAAMAPVGTIEITTKPSPPHKGSNQVLITVHDSSGTSVTDANVSVVFFMSAMPAMGMSAMRVEANAKPENGTYAATVNLQGGGTWNVTVIATRAGKQIATRHLSMSVPGGM